MMAALDKTSETEQINVALERSLNDSDEPKLKKAKKEEDDSGFLDDSGFQPLILSQVPEPAPSVSGAVVTESPDARLDRFFCAGNSN